MPPRATAPVTETEKIIKAVKDELAKFKGEFREMKDLLSDKDKRIVTLEATVAALLADNSNMKARQDQFEAKLDATEAYERRDTFIISGAIDPVTPGEDAKNVAISLIARKLDGFQLNPTDISVAHRLQVKLLLLDSRQRHQIST